MMVEYAHMNVHAKYYTDLSNRGVTMGPTVVNRASRAPYLGAQQAGNSLQSVQN